MTTKFDNDRLVGISAMLIGLCSLFIVVYQTVLTRESARASVLPYLMIALQSNNERVFLLVNNNGIGPALIDDVRVVSPGGVFDGDPFEYIASLPPFPEAAGGIDVDRLVPGRLIPAGATIFAVGQYGEGQAMLPAFLRMFDLADAPDSWYTGYGYDPNAKRAVIELDYSSVYGEHFRLRSDTNVPQPL